MPGDNNHDHIQLRDDSVQEILSRPPSWLLRWGTTLILILTLFLFFLAWWVKYPDLVTAPVVLSTPQPPAPVVSQTAGQLTALLVEDNETVEAGQQLAILQSQADPDAVFALKQQLKQLGPLHPDTLLQLELPLAPQLGELQSPYSDFSQNLESYRLFLQAQTDLQQIPFLQKEIQFLQGQNQELKEKDSILLAEKRLTKQSYDRQKEALSFGGTIAERVEQLETQLLQYDRQRQDLRVQRLDNSIRINQLQTQIADIRRRTEEASQGRYIEVKESLQRLKAALKAWMDTYVLRAPMAGRVAFFQFYSLQQYVPAGAEVFTILPQFSKVQAKVLLPVQGSGKVEEGQLANIKLHAFPYREYGIIRAKVERISLMAQDNGLMVELRLPDGMKTTYRQSLPFRQQMQGTAEIVTKERRLLERFVEGFFTGE